MSLFNWFERIDRILFVLIHRDSDHESLDGIMLFLRNPLTWIPLYLFLLWYAGKHAKDQAWKFILLSVFTFSLTDSISSRLLKPWFGRVRPCFDPSLQTFLRNLVDCGGLYSFPSSHAANHFGLAAFWYWGVLLMTGKRWNWLWIWAALIGYAQVYVGKHYPLDIAGGALLGWLTGTAAAKIFHRWAYRGKIICPAMGNRDNGISSSLI